MHNKPRSKRAIEPKAEPTMKINRVESAVSASHQDGDLVFFWKEDKDNGWLWQWYRSSFTDPDLDGLTFNCAGQYMMYRKALLFNDTAVAAEIMKCKSAGQQRSLGREIKPYDEAKWCEARFEIMRRGNWLKFSTNVTDMKVDDTREPVLLKELLLATRDRELVEASPFDRIWEIGFGAETPGVSRSQWGQNLLGKALMKVRERLQEEKEAAHRG